MSRTYFFWDPLSDNILQERDEAGTVTAEYTTEPGLYGNLISQNRAGVESQYHFDPQGSTLALTDDNQQVTGTYAYSAFGEHAIITGSTDERFLFIGRSGYNTSSPVGDISVRRRIYNARLGRWLSTDPKLHFDSINLYEYVGNSPLVFNDPSGEMRDCAEEQIQCFRWCWRHRVPWPFSLNRASKYQFCQSKCLAEYLACLAEENAKIVLALAALAAARAAYLSAVSRGACTQIVNALAARVQFALSGLLLICVTCCLDHPEYCRGIGPGGHIEIA